MKVLEERDEFVSDYEVLQHLKGIKVSNNKKKKTVTSLETVQQEVVGYLSQRPCSLIENDEKFILLMSFLNQYNLVKVEKLQLVNLLPRSMVHLYSIVEECDQRFDEDTCEVFLNKINELFPLPEEESEESEEKEENEENKNDGENKDNEKQQRK